jgi:hypothetical protein
MFAPAPALPPVTLETAYVEVRAAVAPKEDPIAVLRRADASPERKLAALETLHGSLPLAPQARRADGLEALRASAASAAEAPAVRAKALMYLGYAVPIAGDEAAKAAAVRVLLGAAAAAPYRVYALRGLAPATHGLPAAVEGEFQAALLRLLAGTLSAEERITALVALDSFMRAREDLPRRRPDLVAALESAVLAPVESAPAAFAAGGSPAERRLVIAIVWHSARNRASTGDAKALPRVNALLATLAALETDASVKSQIADMLAADAPKLIP